MQVERRQVPTKNPAKAGFSCAIESQAFDGEPADRLRGLDGLDASGQAALVTRSLVLVNQATGAETV